MGACADDTQDGLSGLQNLWHDAKMTSPNLSAAAATDAHRPTPLSGVQSVALTQMDWQGAARSQNCTAKAPEDSQLPAVLSDMTACIANRWSPVLNNFSSSSGGGGCSSSSPCSMPPTMAGGAASAAFAAKPGATALLLGGQSSSAALIPGQALASGDNAAETGISFSCTEQDSSGAATVSRQCPASYIPAAIKGGPERMHTVSVNAETASVDQSTKELAQAPFENHSQQQQQQQQGHAAESTAAARHELGLVVNPSLQQ